MIGRVLRALRDGPGGADGEGDGERGSAIVEFIGGTLVLLIPLVYLVLTLAELQGAVFAAQGAARDTGRLLATAEDPATAGALAATNVELTFADHGIAVDGERALAITCEIDCSQPGEQALVTVSASVALPFFPDGGASIPVSAQAWTTIDPFRERP